MRWDELTKDNRWMAHGEVQQSQIVRGYVFGFLQSPALKDDIAGDGTGARTAQPMPVDVDAQPMPVDSRWRTAAGIPRTRCDTNQSSHTNQSSRARMTTRARAGPRRWGRTSGEPA
jgi:hypothetical protein